MPPSACPSSPNLSECVSGTEREEMIGQNSLRSSQRGDYFTLREIANECEEGDKDGGGGRG
ncbi:hypothetical protein NQZ68_010457 [Dissostichus eleginoides]|nr:hypothetical protein NQZ68_010457 [Dissostichus eleginoides]